MAGIGKLVEFVDSGGSVQVLEMVGTGSGGKVTESYTRRCEVARMHHIHNVVSSQRMRIDTRYATCTFVLPYILAEGNTI